MSVGENNIYSPRALMVFTVTDHYDYEQDKFDFVDLYQLLKEDNNFDDDSIPLDTTIKQIYKGIIINDNVYLNDIQWHTLTYVNKRVYRCAVCSTYCEKDKSQEHMDSTDHLELLYDTKPLKKYDLSIIRKISSDKHHCGVCNIIFDVKDVEKHEISELHEGNLLYALNKVTDLNLVKKESLDSSKKDHDTFEDIYKSLNQLHEKENWFNESKFASLFPRQKNGNDTNNNRTSTVNPVVDFAEKEKLPNFSEKEKLTHFSEKEKLPHFSEKEKLPHFSEKEKLPHFPDKEKLPHFSEKEKLPHFSQQTTSYANVARTSKVYMPEHLIITHKDKTLKVNFNNWHMIVEATLHIMYCQLCKSPFPSRYKCQHCQSRCHVDKLKKAEIVASFGDFVIRKFDSISYHCGHCNSLQYIGNINTHLQSHTKTNTQSTSTATRYNRLTELKPSNATLNLPQRYTTNANGKIVAFYNDNGSHNKSVNSINNQLTTPYWYTNTMFMSLYMTIRPFGLNLTILRCYFNTIKDLNGINYCFLCDSLCLEPIAHIVHWRHRHLLGGAEFIARFENNLIRAIRGYLHCTLCNESIPCPTIHEHNAKEGHTDALLHAMGLKTKTHWKSIKYTPLSTVQPQESTPRAIKNNDSKRQEYIQLAIKNNDIERQESTPLSIKNNDIEHQESTPLSIKNNDSKRQEYIQLAIKNNDIERQESTPLSIKNNDIEHQESTPLSIKNNDSKRQEYIQLAIKNNDIERQEYIQLAIKNNDIERQESTPLSIKNNDIERQEYIQLAIKNNDIERQESTPLSIKNNDIERQEYIQLAIKNNDIERQESTPLSIKNNDIEHQESTQLAIQHESEKKYSLDSFTPTQMDIEYPPLTWYKLPKRERDSQPLTFKEKPAFTWNKVVTHKSDAANSQQNIDSLINDNINYPPLLGNGRSKKQKRIEMLLKNLEEQKLCSEKTVQNTPNNSALDLDSTEEDITPIMLEQNKPIFSSQNEANTATKTRTDFPRAIKADISNKKTIHTAPINDMPSTSGVTNINSANMSKNDEKIATNTSSIFTPPISTSAGGAFTKFDVITQGFMEPSKIVDIEEMINNEDKKSEASNSLEIQENVEVFNINDAPKKSSKKSEIQTNKKLNSKCSKVNDSETSKEVARNSKETATSNKEVATSNREVAKTNKDVTLNNETAVSTKEVATSSKVAMACKEKSSTCHKTSNKTAKTAGKVPKKSSHKAKNVQTEVSIPQTPDKEVATSDKDFAVSKAETTTEKEVATSDKEMTLLNKEVSTSDNEMTLLNKEMSTSDKEMTLLNKEVSTSDKEMTLLNKEVSTPDKEMTLFNKEVSTSDKEMTLLNKEVSTLDKEMTLLNKEVSTSDNEMTLLNKEVSTSDKEMTLLNKEVSTTDKEMTLLNKEVSTSDKEMTLLNKEVSTLDKEMTLLNKEVSTSDNEMTLLNKEVSTSDKEMTLLNKEVSTTDKEMTLLNKEVSTSDKEMTLLNKEVSTSDKEMTLLHKEVSTSDKEMTLLNKKVSTSDKEMTLLNKEVSTSDKQKTLLNKEVSPSDKEVSNQDKDDDATSDIEDDTSTEDSSTSTDTESSSSNNAKISKKPKKITHILTKIKSRKSIDNFKNFDKLKNEKLIQELETNKANTILIKMPHIKSLQKCKRKRFKTEKTTPKSQQKSKKCKKHRKSYKLGRVKKVVNARNIANAFKIEPRTNKLKNTDTVSSKMDQPRSNTKQKLACRINALKRIAPKDVTDKVGNSKKIVNFEMTNSKTEIKNSDNPERIENCTATDTEVNRVQSETKAQTSTNINIDAPSLEDISVQTTDIIINNDTTVMPITTIKHEEPGLNLDTTRCAENVSKIDCKNYIKTTEKKCDKTKNPVKNTNEDTNGSLKRNTLTEFMGESSATIDNVSTQPVNIKKEKSAELISKTDQEKKITGNDTKRKESKHQAKKTNDVNGNNSGNTITESKTDESKKLVKKSKNDNDNKKTSNDMKNENVASKSVKTEKVSKKEQEREIKKSKRKYTSKHLNNKSHNHNESANGNVLTETNEKKATIYGNSSKKSKKVTEKKSKSVKTSPSCPINSKKAKKGKRSERNQGKTTKQNNSYKNYSENANGTENDANGSQNNDNGSNDNDNNEKRKPFNDLTINELTSNEEKFDPYELVLVKLKSAYFQISIIAYHGLILADGARYCCVCCVTVPISMIPKHIESEQHKENMDENTFLETCGNQLFRQMYTQFQCAICNILMYRKEIKMHLEWQTHIDKYDQSYNNLGKKQQKSLAGIQQFILKTKKQFNFMNNKEEKYKITNHHLTSYKVDWYSIIADNLTNYSNKKNKIIVLCCVVVKIDFYLWNGIVGSNKMKCILCQTDIEDLDAHIRTEKHKSMADKDVLKFFYPAMVRKMDESSLNCITCNTILPLDLKLMKEHIKGKKHIISFDTHSGEEVSISSYKDCYHKVIML